MKKRFFTFLFLIVISLHIVAQNPGLPIKGELSQTLLSQRVFSKSNEIDIVKIEHEIGKEYCLEVSARINSAQGRGLDMEVRNYELKGFRLSLDTTFLKWTSPLTVSNPISFVTPREDQTIRIAVKSDTAYIFQNGAFIDSQPLMHIKNIKNGEEVEEDEIEETNLISDWAGTESDNLGKPSDYGWDYTGTTQQIFNTANSGSGVRYLDVDENNVTHTLNGEIFIGRIMFIRWDNNSIINTVYGYPVTLEANTTYNLSLLHAYWANATGNRTMTVGINESISSDNYIASKILSNGNQGVLNKSDLTFTTNEAGIYYITFTGDWGLFSIGQLKLNKVNSSPRFIFGKNYTDGSVDMEILSVTYEEGAYAPEPFVEGPRRNILVSDKIVSYPTSINKNFILDGSTELHLAGEYNPLVNSRVEINSNDAWVYFDNIRPSVVKSDWLDKIIINGIPASNNENIRIAIYKNGTVIIPNGKQTDKEALVVFSEPFLNGESMNFAIEKYYNNLGEFDNAIRSFILKKGYMATLATNPDGLGFSRVFIADKDDLVFNTMPEGLDSTVSFIRVFRWNWVSKKGKAGWNPDKINATWYYDWNIGGASSDNYDYVAIRQNGGWPSWEAINNKPNINHLLGFNEPDRPDQANMTVDQVIAQWPEMMKSGLRLGSPAPSDPFNGFIPQFMERAEELNYRVDFIAIHCYWGGMSPQTWYDRLKQVYNWYKRPLWITEWNNGANWTNEPWPENKTEQFEKQLNDLKGILLVLDTASFVERYAIYDWVEEKRALVLGDTLTPAGKYYAANKSDFAFNREYEYVHTWKPLGPHLNSSISDEDHSKVILSWEDINGELGLKYILERKINGVDDDFLPIKEFTDYDIGSTLNVEDNVYDAAIYRVKAFDKFGTFAYSNNHEVTRDPNPYAPGSLTGKTISATILEINWTSGTNARSYNLKRSLSEEGPFETVLSHTNLLTYRDENLNPNTTYYYVVTSLNSAGESENSTVLKLKTNILEAPEKVKNPRIASGDKKITLTWDLLYDVKYDILKADSLNGEFKIIASNWDGLRYVDYDVENDNDYFYKIVAHNEAGRSPETQVLEGKPKLGQHLFLSFNEPSGRFAEDIWGGFHGNLGATANHVDGKNYKAIKLVGSEESFVSIEEGIVADIEDFTIVFWAKINGIDNWMRIFDFGSGTSQYMFFTIQAGEIDGKSILRYAIKNNSEEQRLNFEFAVPLNEWIHFAITQNNDTASLYLNGELVAFDTITIKPSSLGITKQNYIGKSQFVNDPMFIGSIDEFAIFNYALSREKIQNIIDNGIPNPKVDTYLPFQMISDHNNLKVFPNPVNSEINVVGNLKDNYQYGIYNIDGRKLLTGLLEYGKIQIPHQVPNGIYILEITNGQNSVFKTKIVIQKN